MLLSDFMNRRKKGMGNLLIALTLIFILIFVWTPTGSLKGETSQNYITIIREDDTNTVQNSLDLANTFIETSLNYAVYHAMNDESPINDDLDLTQSVLENLNRYTKSGERIITCMGKKMKLPVFKKITIEPHGIYMKIKAEAEKNLYFETKLNENDILYQEKEINLESIYSFSVFGMKDEAQKVFDSIKSNSCDNRKYDDKCGRYHCKAESTMETTCKTTVEVIYKENIYPVQEGSEKVFKNLGLTFIFKE